MQQENNTSNISDNTFNRMMFELLAHAARHESNGEINFSKPLTMEDHLAAIHRMQTSNVPVKFQDAYKNHYSIDDMTLQQHDVTARPPCSSDITQNKFELMKRLRLAEEIIEMQQQQLEQMRLRLSNLNIGSNEKDESYDYN